MYWMECYRLGGRALSARSCGMVWDVGFVDTGDGGGWFAGLSELERARARGLFAVNFGRAVARDGVLSGLEAGGGE